MTLVAAYGRDRFEYDYNKIITCMDKLFPFFIGEFDIYDAVRKSNLSVEEKKEAIHFEREIQHQLIEVFQYAQYHPET